MTRVLFLGDMAATGFGTVTMDLGRAMLAGGDDVRFVSMNEWGGELPEPFGSRTFVVGDRDGQYADAFDLVAHLKGGAWADGWKPEAVLVLGDYAGVRYALTRMDPTLLAAFGELPAFHYCPVEGIDLPPSWGELWHTIQPVAMSAFGAQELSKVTGRPTPMIYHGVDSLAFRPIRPDRPLKLEDGTFLRSKRDARRLFGGDPDRVWMLRTDRLVSRKRYASLLRAAAPVLARHPGVDLVIHARSVDEGGNLHDAKSKFARAVQAQIILTGLHETRGPLDRTELCALYNAADLYVSTSAEGFGLTIAEAIACGTPAVGLGYSAVPEVIGPAGVICPAAGLVDNEYDHFWAAADEDALSAILEDLCVSRTNRERLGHLGPAHVRANFQWKAAAAAFAQLFAQAVAGRAAA